MHLSLTAIPRGQAVRQSYTREQNESGEWSYGRNVGRCEEGGGARAKEGNSAEIIADLNFAKWDRARGRMGWVSFWDDEIDDGVSERM